MTLPLISRILPPMKRLEPKQREAQILATALTLAESKGYAQVRRDTVAEAAGISPALVNVHFGTMADFRRALMRYAVRERNLRVIAQGLAAGDRHAEKAPEGLKRAACLALVG